MRRGPLCAIITNGDGTQQRVHGVGEVCLPFDDRNKAKYTFNIQRALYVPSFKFHLKSVSLLVEQGDTVIFNQNPHINYLKRSDKKA